MTSPSLPSPVSDLLITHDTSDGATTLGVGFGLVVCYMDHCLDMYMGGWGIDLIFDFKIFYYLCVVTLSSFWILFISEFHIIFIYVCTL